MFNYNRLPPAASHQLPSTGGQWEAGQIISIHLHIRLKQDIV